MEVNKHLYKVKKNGDIDSLDLFKIRWYLTLWCNYRCEYCYQREKHSQENLNGKFEQLKKDAIHIHNIIEENVKKDYMLQLIGGEVTYFDLPELLDIVYTPNFKKLVITTNFSRDNEKLKEIIQWVVNHNISLFLLCSYHDSQVEFDKFFNKILDLKQYIDENMYENIRIHPTLVLTNENIDTGYKMVEFCKSNNISFGCNVCNEPDGSTNVTVPADLPLTSESLKDKQQYAFLIDNKLYGREVAKNEGKTRIGNLYCSRSLCQLVFKNNGIYDTICGSHHKIGTIDTEEVTMGGGYCLRKNKIFENCSITCNNICVDTNPENVINLCTKGILPDIEISED